MSAGKEFVWFWGFKIFYTFEHPISEPFKTIRKVAQKFKRSEEPSSESLPPKTVPKKIWIFWAQGWDNAPPLVMLCRDSWLAYNPGWELVLLDKKNIAEYVTLPYSLEGKEVSHAAYSDIVRLSLLSKYGGVWVDATCFCTASLDSWLPPLMQSGFFAFTKPKSTIASWFLAAEANTVLVQKWEAYVTRYWKRAKKAERYFWVHYLFEYLIWRDATARALWKNTPRISSDGPYALQRCLKGKCDMHTIEELLDAKTIHIHKLDWKWENPKLFLDTLQSRL